MLYSFLSPTANLDFLSDDVVFKQQGMGQKNIKFSNVAVSVQNIRKNFLIVGCWHPFSLPDGLDRGSPVLLLTYRKFAQISWHFQGFYLQKTEVPE